MPNRDAMITNNIRLVHRVIRKMGYIPLDQDYEDMLSIGCIGLINAVDTFSKDSGNTFGTYAYSCIRNAILKDKKHNSYAKRKAPQMISLDYVVNDETGATISDVIPDTANLESDVEVSVLCGQAISKLSGNRKTTIQMLMDGYQRVDAAKELGVSRERIRQYVNESLNVLRPIFFGRA